MPYINHTAHRSASRRSIRTRKTRTTLTRGAMLSDICLVVVWAATIPGLMWLGAAGGF